MKSVKLTNPKTEGPIKRPAIISPTTCGAFNFLATMPNNFAKITIIAKSLKTKYDSILAPSMLSKALT